MEMRDTYYRLLNQPAPTYPRYLAIQIDFGGRLTGLIGPRGSGKTTLMLQWIKEIKNVYDSFPKVRIVFSDSSSLDLVKGHYDLGNRLPAFPYSGSSATYTRLHRNRSKNDRPLNRGKTSLAIIGPSVLPASD
jgi:AAA+ ATPase superfamily predicted ATPase